MQLKDYRIGVVGCGVVGTAVAKSYAEHVRRVYCWDKDLLRANCDVAHIWTCDVIFVCLPSPAKDDGSLDLSSLYDFFRDVDRIGMNDRNFVLRSTVPIGATRALATSYKLTNLVHSPEFLTARCANLDASMPTRNLVGYTEKSGMGRAPSDPRACCNVVMDLYAERFPHVPVHRMSSDETEAVKLFVNGFFAVKVAYWNEVRCLAEKFGLAWDSVMAAVLGDGRIHPSHTQVPGPDGKFGFGGACLPKDLMQLFKQLTDEHCDNYVTGGAHLFNNKVRE